MTSIREMRVYGDGELAQRLLDKKGKINKSKFYGESNIYSGSRKQLKQAYARDFRYLVTVYKTVY